MTIQGNIVLLTLAYGALVALLLTILMRLPISRAAKVVTIMVMCAFNVAVFYWSQGLVGWSSATIVPERFQLLWARVIEPNPAKDHLGAIHLWVEELDDRNIPSGEPRAFLLPYSAALASKATSAQAEIKKGNPQGGTRQAFIPTIGGPAVDGANIRTIRQGATPGGDPSGGGVLDPAALGGQSKSVNLIPLPKPLLPPKDELPMETAVP